MMLIDTLVKLHTITMSCNNTNSTNTSYDLDSILYVTAAGSKSKLITSMNSFRNKDRLKAVVDVIKALP